VLGMLLVERRGMLGLVRAMLGDLLADLGR
jgi:hypothetical protein